MVSIDLQKAGRLIGQPVVVLEAKQLCEDHLHHINSKTDAKVDKVVVENRPGIISKLADNPKKSGSEGQAEAPKKKQERRRESKQRHDSKTENDKGHPDDRQLDTPRQKHDGHSDLYHREDKNQDSNQSHVSQPETQKSTSKVEFNSRRGENKIRDRHKDREGDKDGGEDKDKDRNKDRSKNKERDRVKDKDRERDRNKDKDRDKDKNKEIGRNKDSDRDKDIDKNKDRDRVKDIDKNKERDRVKDIDRNKDRDKNKDKDRTKDRDRDKDRKRKHQASWENCSKYSPDQHTKPESSPVKQDRSRKSTDLNSRQRTETFSVPNAQNKEERRSGDGSISGQARNKQQSFEAKLSEFPSYLLGGKSGSLKNFVIPKLTREGRDPKVPNKLNLGFGEPLVRLERVSLIENLNKRAKPMVVLRRLSIDEIKRIIKESRNAHSSWRSSEKGTIY